MAWGSIDGSVNGPVMGITHTVWLPRRPLGRSRGAQRARRAWGAWGTKDQMKLAITRLLTSAAALALAAPGLAHAQAAAETAVSEIVVTGSRLPRSGLDAPFPVQVVDGETIRKSGQVLLGDVL